MKEADPVAIREEEEKPVIEAPPLKQFVGTMKKGMAVMMSVTILLMLLSIGTMWWTRGELIFHDRMIPKFAFDVARTVITLGFAAFWI